MLKEQYKPDSNSENATIDLNGMLKNSQEKE
jgi:hypothetical protein